MRSCPIGDRVYELMPRCSGSCLVPLTTKLTLRLPHLLQTSRLPHAGTVVWGPYQRACSAGSGSLRWPQALHQTLNVRWAAAAVPKVIGGLEGFTFKIPAMSQLGVEGGNLRSARQAEFARLTFNRRLSEYPLDNFVTMDLKPSAMTEQNALRLPGVDFCEHRLRLPPLQQ